ncbi:uncharacterized protein PgNI_03523 [Pyricularia grisea]|uniref:Uncharacterized protein n=1 Tax=Pyricularia grisea TaxID=148305 RepID=A0A6P8BEA9_PYRGI|nr:uncharacterized protein PgNI_03523 [Pyricularia grisea]XP_030985574.1 uncharacterized protein PgNI_03523 [Pyricularia grisea]TLD14216.1 hypothetical protein PgNI_03523 [Pyricularia grisea]TLD14217.1 hypothetical protein PgNI_03523 [Pyricularia grisea]
MHTFLGLSNSPTMRGLFRVRPALDNQRLCQNILLFLVPLSLRGSAFFNRKSYVNKRAQQRVLDSNHFSLAHQLCLYHGWARFVGQGHGHRGNT